jgi:hypothetical protein
MLSKNHLYRHLRASALSSRLWKSQLRTYRSSSAITAIAADEVMRALPALLFFVKVGVVYTTGSVSR